MSALSFADKLKRTWSPSDVSATPKFIQQTIHLHLHIQICRGVWKRTLRRKWESGPYFQNVVYNTETIVWTWKQAQMSLCSAEWPSNEAWVLHPFLSLFTQKTQCSALSAPNYVTACHLWHTSGRYRCRLERFQTEGRTVTMSLTFLGSALNYKKTSARLSFVTEMILLYQESTHRREISVGDSQCTQLPIL